MLDAQFSATVESYRAHLSWFAAEGVLPDSLVAGKRVLDWECGSGAFSVAMLQQGAAEAVAIDSRYNHQWTPADVRETVEPTRQDIRDLALDPSKQAQFDLVFSNTVTEHILDLPGALSAAFLLLKPGGHFFTNHGNYYNPTGHHDHGFLNYANGGVEFMGPRCWESDEKCDASAEFRGAVAVNYPWTMPPNFNSYLAPGDCKNCIYFKRAQPWAHLLHHEEFRTVFGNPQFTTGRAHSSLNKMTSFQVRQMLVEAGFDLVKHHRDMVCNEPPAELLVEPYNFNAIELRTGAHRFLSQKPRDHV